MGRTEIYRRRCLRIAEAEVALDRKRKTLREGRQRTTLLADNDDEIAVLELHHAAIQILTQGRQRHDMGVRGEMR